MVWFQTFLPLGETKLRYHLDILLWCDSSGIPRKISEDWLIRKETIAHHKVSLAVCNGFWSISRRLFGSQYRKVCLLTCSLRQKCVSLLTNIVYTHYVLWITSTLLFVTYENWWQKVTRFTLSLSLKVYNIWILYSSMFKPLWRIFRTLVFDEPRETVWHLSLIHI